jgi:hypothetical protein
VNNDDDDDDETRSSHVMIELERKRKARGIFVCVSVPTHTHSLSRSLFRCRILFDLFTHAQTRACFVMKTQPDTMPEKEEEKKNDDYSIACTSTYDTRGLDDE